MISVNPSNARPAAGVLRHLLSILALPLMNTVAMPTAILAAAGRGGFDGWLPMTRLADTLGAAVGLALLLVGTALVVTSIGLFAASGEGTLAPWDPPRRLVVSGPYRYVRNPMKAGLVFVLIAEALLLESPALAIWCAFFATVNIAYIRVSEEPGLQRRFGSAYAEYCAAVPAWLPRLSPWAPPTPAVRPLPVSAPGEGSLR